MQVSVGLICVMNINCEILDLRAFQLVVELESFKPGCLNALNILATGAQPPYPKAGDVDRSSAARAHDPSRFANCNRDRNSLPLVRRMTGENSTAPCLHFANALVSKQRRGLVTMACIPTAAFYFLPKVIRQFNQEYPHIRFRILDLTASGWPSSGLARRSGVRHQSAGYSDPELEFEFLTDDPFVLAVRSDHPLASKAEVQWSEFGNYPTYHSPSIEQQPDAARRCARPCKTRAELVLRGHPPQHVAGPGGGWLGHFCFAETCYAPRKPPPLGYTRHFRSCGYAHNRSCEKARRYCLASLRTFP